MIRSSESFFKTKGFLKLQIASPQEKETLPCGAATRSTARVAAPEGALSRQALDGRQWGSRAKAQEREGEKNCMR